MGSASAGGSAGFAGPVDGVFARAVSTGLGMAAGESGDETLRSRLSDADSLLAALAHRAPSAELHAMADLAEAGPIALLGTPHTASTYAALFWNGERFHAEHVPWTVRLLFLARTMTPEPDRHAAAVAAGEAVRSTWPPPPSGVVAAGLTVDTVAAAACTAVALGLDAAAADEVGELGAALMLVTPAEPSASQVALYAGHALASGWLAAQLHHAGLVAAPGTATEVLATREAP